MQQTFLDIQAWVSENAPSHLPHLNGPANADEIEMVENEIGLKLPEDFKEFLKLHNGEDDTSWLAILGDGNQLLTCESIINQYKIEQQVGRDLLDPEMETVEFWKDRVAGNVIFIKGAVQPLTLHQRWIPFTNMNGDVIRYFDFSPAPGGVAGQVIEVDQEGCVYEVVANSFSDMLEAYLSDLRNGKYQVDEEGYIESTEQKEIYWGMPDWLNDA